MFTGGIIEFGCEVRRYRERKTTSADAADGKPAWHHQSVCHLSNISL